MKKKTNKQIVNKVFEDKILSQLKKLVPIQVAHPKDWKKAVDNAMTFDSGVIQMTKEEFFKLENPKEAIGQAKPSLHHVPPRVLLEVAQAMMEGSKKYGIYNYRKAGVSYSTYYSSTFRHLCSWFEGEDIDPDSGISHVVKAVSGLIVLYDSILEGNATDDRPTKKNIHG